MPQLIEVPGHGQVEFPDGMSDEDIATAIKKNLLVGKPATPKSKGLEKVLELFLGETPPEHRAIIQNARDKGWGSGYPKVAYDAGGKVTDLTGSPEAGFATNVIAQAIPSFLTSASPAGAPSLLNVPARKLMQSAVKPGIADLRSGDAGRAIGTMLEEGIYPTSSGMAKAAKITGKLDAKVEQAIANSQATVPVAAIGSRLRDPYQRALTQVNPQDDLNAIRTAWDQFKTSPLIAGKTQIPVQLAQDIKKGTYQALGGKSYGEVKSASVEAQKALARGAREEIAQAVPEVSAPLARQAELMNVRSVAGDRALMEANKNPLGLAGLRMDDPLSAATFLADRWAALKAFLAFQLNAAGKSSSIVPPGVTAGILSSQQPPAGVLSERR